MSQNGVLATLQSIFGLDTVEEALENQASIVQWQLTNIFNRLTVLEAQQQLEAKLNSLHEAMVFASGLDTTVKFCVILEVLAQSKRPCWNLAHSDQKL